MKVLFCDNGLNPFLNFRGYVASHFHAKGYEVALIIPESTCNDNNLGKTPEYLHLYKVQMNRNGSNPFDDIIYYKTLLRLFKEITPDIIFTYTIKPNIYGSIAAHHLKIPVVAMVAGLGYAFSCNSLKHKLGRILYKYGLRKANKVIVLNQSNLEILKNNGFVRPENIILFEGGEGVDLNHFNFVNDDYTDTRFLMVARVLYDRGYTEYVEAAKIVKQKHPHVKVELLGPLAEDSPMGVPSHIVKSDNDSGYIKYLGETDDVIKYVGLNGVVVVVSSYHEGFNRSLMEACAMGRICISSNIPGCREIVENNYNGYLVNPKDSTSLANAMNSLIEASPEARKRMANNSYNKAKSIFDVKFVLKKYDEILHNLHNKKSNESLAIG